MGMADAWRMTGGSSTLVYGTQTPTAIGPDIQESDGQTDVGSFADEYYGGDARQGWRQRGDEEVHPTEEGEAGMQGKTGGGRRPCDVRRNHRPAEDCGKTRTVDIRRKSSFDITSCTTQADVSRNHVNLAPRIIRHSYRLRYRPRTGGWFIGSGKGRMQVSVDRAAADSARTLRMMRWCRECV